MGTRVWTLITAYLQSIYRLWK